MSIFDNILTNRLFKVDISAWRNAGIHRTITIINEVKIYVVDISGSKATYLSAYNI